MSNSIALNPTLTIADIIIRQDEGGRYCLNDLHKASGGEQKNRPNYFLDIQQTKDLITEIESTAGNTAVEQNQAVKVINGGNKQGTYGIKDIVYAYAMWISPAFTLKVIRAYDALVTGKPQYGLKALPEPPTITKAQQGELFTRAKHIAGSSGKIRAELWSRFQNHFKLSSYKDLPAEKYEEALAYLDAKQVEYNNGVEMVWISRHELEAIQALPSPAKEGELLGKPANTLTVDLNTPEGMKQIKFVFNTQGLAYGRWAMWQSDGDFTVSVLDNDEFMASPQSLPKRIAEPGFIPRQYLPAIIEAAAQRLK